MSHHMRNADCLNIFQFLLIAFAVILTNVNGRSNQGTNSFVCNKMSELPKVINFKRFNFSKHKTVNAHIFCKTDLLCQLGQYFGTSRKQCKRCTLFYKNSITIKKISSNLYMVSRYFKCYEMECLFPVV